jgi:hypothetical protein
MRARSDRVTNPVLRRAHHRAALYSWHYMFLVLAFAAASTPLCDLPVETQSGSRHNTMSKHACEYACRGCGNATLVVQQADCVMVESLCDHAVRGC